MPTLTEIAIHWGVTKGRVSQLVKEGCPTNSVRAADLWRQNRGWRRAPTNGKVVEEPKKRGRRIKNTGPPDTGDSLLDAVNRSHYIRNRASDEYMDAYLKDSASRSQRLSEHCKAVELCFKAEKAYREDLERRGILAPRLELMAIARRCLDTVLRRIKKLPNECGPQCNELEPLKAVKILQRAVDEILTAGANAVREIQ